MDPSQITEALGHGLENAARYSPSGSEIAVSAARLRTARVPARRRPRTGDSRRPRSGPGVRAFRAAAGAPAVPGTGLGLSIARSLVEMNGGRLTLGRLPDRGNALRDRASGRGRMSRVLVGDDEAAIRKVVRDALTKAGHDVETAVDGEEAQALLASGEFDLVITDLNMPRMNGLELVRRIRAVSGPDPRPDRPPGGARKSPAPRRRSRRLRHETLRHRRAPGAGPGAAAADGGPAGRGPALAVGGHRGRSRRPHGSASRPARAPDADRVLAVERLPVEAGSRLDPQAAALTAVWGSVSGISNDTLRVHMGSLRRKLEYDPNRPRWIRTEPWVGYRLSPEE